MIAVTTRNFETAHGKKPKGFGMWAFDVNNSNGTYFHWTTPTGMLYTQAKKELNIAILRNNRIAQTRATVVYLLA